MQDKKINAKAANNSMCGLFLAQASRLCPLSNDIAQFDKPLLSMCGHLFLAQASPDCWRKRLACAFYLLHVR